MPRSISTIRYAPAQTEVMRDIVKRACAVYGKVPRAFGQSEADAAVRSVARRLGIDEQTIEEAVDAFEQFIEDRNAADDFEHLYGGDRWLKDDLDD